MTASEDNFFDATNHEYQFQNTATLPFSIFARTRNGTPLYNRGIPLKYPFTNLINQLENTQLQQINQTDRMTIHSC